MQTNLYGANENYKEILSLVNKSLDILNETGHSISDACWFGIDVETKNKEFNIYENIKIKLKDVESELLKIIIEDK